MYKTTVNHKTALQSPCLQKPRRWRMNLQNVHAYEDETVIKLCISQGYGAEWIPNHRDLSDRVKELSEIDNEPLLLLSSSSRHNGGFFSPIQDILYRPSETTRGRDGPARTMLSFRREKGRT